MFIKFVSDTDKHLVVEAKSYEVCTLGASNNPDEISPRNVLGVIIDGTEYVISSHERDYSAAFAMNDQGKTIEIIRPDPEDTVTPIELGDGSLLSVNR